MPVAMPSVLSIVESHCHDLLKRMNAANPSADLGISVALYFPSDTAVPSYFHFGTGGPGVEITPETIFAIGSVTKVFTATLAAYLRVQGAIGDLNEALVASYLSNPACNPSGVTGAYWESATFAQFATQTSGMPDEANGHYSKPLFHDEPPPCSQVKWWNDEALSFTTDQGDWVYSNAGFVTLGYAVVAAAASLGLGDGYPALLQNVITTPIYMPNTFVADNVPSGAVLAQGYNGAKPVPITAADDMKSTAQDLLAFLGAVYQAMMLEASGDPLTPLEQALVAAASVWISDPVLPDKDPTGFAMGLGWQIPTIGSSQVLAKDGLTSRGGCSCWVGLTRYAANGPAVGIALMTNQVSVAPDSTARAILTELLAIG